MTKKSELAGDPVGQRVWFAQRRDWIRSSAKAFFLLLLCGYFALSYTVLPFFLNMSRYTDGLERKPYQYRVLPMFVFRILMRSKLPLKVAAHMSSPYNDPYRIVQAGLAFVCLFIAVLATRATIARLTNDRIFAYWSALLVVFMAQLDIAYAWDNPFTTPYDVPAVMFFALAIYLVLRRSWWLYGAVFLLAVVNRETACFITVFFAIWQWFRLEGEGKPIRSRLGWIVPGVAVQAVLWIVIKVLLARHFAQNAAEVEGHVGGLYITHFGYNLKELLKPQQWPMLASVCGFSLPFLYLNRRWIGSKGLTWALGIILPLSFAVLLVLGVINEIRIFADWIPLVVPSIALILFHRFRPVEG